MIQKWHKSILQTLIKITFMVKFMQSICSQCTFAPKTALNSQKFLIQNKKMKYVFILFCWFVFQSSPLFAQNARDTMPHPGGGWARIEVENGDTIYIAMLRSVSIRGQRVFGNIEDQRKYSYYKRCAAKVYPYAVEAVKLYNDMREETADMSRHQRKKFAKANQKDLEGQYEKELKNLSKIQGHVLIEMIERYTNQPFYDIVKQTRGGMTAMYWNGFGKIWGYDLKEKYEIGQDPVLDAVLQDFDLSMSLGNE
jgi:hypothetical protein